MELALGIFKKTRFLFALIAAGAAGALAGAVLQMDHEAGGGVFFAEAGGYDAHHALMPFLTGKHQRVPLLRPQPLDLGDGVGNAVDDIGNAVGNAVEGR